MENNTKPPFGVMPRDLHDEARLRELLEAVLRYLDVKQKIDPEWIQEINDLLKRFENYDADEGFYKKNFLKTFGIESGDEFVVKRGAGDAVPTIYIPCTKPAESTLVEYKNDKIEDQHTCLNCKHCITMSDKNWFICDITNKEVPGDPFGQDLFCWNNNDCPRWKK